jgi:hypothetical protein
MLKRITKVEYLEDYKLKLFFRDNTIKIVDFEEWVKNGKGYLLPLNNIKYFKKVRVDDCQYTICWPNGADFCPDVLYEMGEEVKSTKNKKSSPSQASKQQTRVAAKTKRIH